MIPLSLQTNGTQRNRPVRGAASEPAGPPGAPPPHACMLVFVRSCVSVRIRVCICEPVCLRPASVLKQHMFCRVRSGAARVGSGLMTKAEADRMFDDIMGEIEVSVTRFTQICFLACLFSLLV